MSDVFGYTNDIKTSGQVANADFASVSINGANALVQSCQVTYGQTIEEVSQVGSTQIFWMPGRPRGNINVSTLVGPTGFFSHWRGKCGVLGTASIKAGDDTCGFTGGGTLTFEGPVVESLSLDVSVGKRTIAQSANIRVASMSA
jgi:hypothetical protein